MTSKLTITDERLAELVAFKPLPGTDINSATRDEWMAMAAELQERRNAAMDSEPGKWIPVSERVPDDRTQVILWDAEIGEVTSGHYSHKTQAFYHCGDAIENEITHWMPPPCAPQEDKP